MAQPVSEPSYRSFLVRLWQAEASATPATWQGEVAHIQSGAQWHFASLHELLVFLAQQADECLPCKPGRRRFGKRCQRRPLARQ